MIKAIIADDEPADLCFLRRALESTGHVVVVAETLDGAECERLVDDHSPDVIFLDVGMPDLSGLEVAERLLASEHAPAVVFITGHDEHAVKAYELEVFDYIVKSADLSAFCARIEHTVLRLLASAEHQALALADWREALGEKMMAQYAVSKVTRLPVKDYDERTIRLIDISLIVWAEWRGKQTILHTEKKDFPMYDSLTHLAQHLGAAGFAHISRGALVNLDYVEHLIPNGDGTYDLILKDASKTVITASRSGAKRLLHTLGM